MEHISHNCDALFLTCMDWRIHSSGSFVPQLQDLSGAKNFDLVALAGGAKNILHPDHQKLVLYKIELSQKLHNICKVIIANHTDCGAYGSEGTQEKLLKDLSQAKDILMHSFPHLEIISLLIFVRPENGMWKIQFQNAKEIANTQ